MKKKKNIDSDFLHSFEYLADQYLRDKEKTAPVWEKRFIPMAHSELNEFYIWIKKTQRIGNNPLNTLTNKK